MGNNTTKPKIPTVEVTPSPRLLHEFVAERIRNYGSRVAQVDSATGERVTFDAILERSAALAAGLTARGLRPGDVALIIGENSVHYPWVLLGVLQTGAAAHLINPRSTPREVEHAMSISRPTVALLSTLVSKEAGVTSVLRDAACVQHILEWGGGDVQSSLPDGISPLELLLASPAKSAVSAPCSPVVAGGGQAPVTNTPRAPPPTPTSLAATYGSSCSPCMNMSDVDVSPVQKVLLLQADGLPPTQGSSVALILSSSGSTGLPKGVMLTNDNLLAALELGPTFVESGDVMLGVSPYYHAYGGVLMLMACCAGVPVVALSKFSVDAMLRAVEEHKVTVMHVVSSLLVSLSKLGVQNEAMLQPLRSLRRLWSGAAQISPLVQVALQNRLPNVRLAHSYGMTETTFTTFCGEVRADKPGSPGKLVPGLECKVIDPENGKTLPMSSRGELCFRGQLVMRGYLGNAEATNEAIDAEGWLHSGDLGFVDEDGYYYIVERLKDILKYNGHQVSPSELEALLTTHPAVSEAAVIGEPHEYGDAPRALVILTQGAEVTAEELQSYIASKVAPHKQLRGGISFVTSFPRTGSGKLQRKKLRALLLDEDHDSSTTSASTVPGDESAPSSPERAVQADSPAEPTAAEKALVSSFEADDKRPLHRPSLCSLSTIYSTSTLDSPVLSSPAASDSFQSPVTPVAVRQVRVLREAADVPLPPSDPNSPVDLEPNASLGSCPMDLASPDAVHCGKIEEPQEPLSQVAHSLAATQLVPDSPN